MSEYPNVQIVVPVAVPDELVAPSLGTPILSPTVTCPPPVTLVAGSVPPQWAASIAATQVVPAPRNAVAKRALDITVALLVLLVTLPFYPILLLAIRLDSKGPALFRQVRAGQNGRLFTVYKFRSMHYSPQASDPLYERIATSWLRGVPLTADLPVAVAFSHPHESETEALPAHVAASMEGVGSRDRLDDAVRTPHPKYKLKNDPRITTVGRLLRATSIDELPQFLNVLRGDMSIVGPRPAIPYEVERYFPQDFGRLLVKPGITGLWQVEGRGHVSFRQMIDMDMEYVANNSFWQDVGLIVRTIPAVLFARGAA